MERRRAGRGPNMREGGGERGKGKGRGEGIVKSTLDSSVEATSPRAPL